MKTCNDLYKETFQKVTASKELKDKLMNIPNESKRAKGKKSKKITVLLVAAIITAVSCVSVYAGVKLYNMYTEKQGKYAETMVLQKNDGTLSLDKKADANHPEYVKLDFKYLPKDLEVLEGTNNSKYYFKDTYAMGGMSLFLYDVSDSDTIKANNTDVIDSELTTINGSDVLYPQKKLYYEYSDSTPGFDKYFYMYFKDYDCMLFGLIGTDICKEELYKILEGATLSEGTKDNYFDCLKWTVGDSSDDDLIEVNNSGNSGYSEKLDNFYNIGDSIPVTEDSSITMTVNSVDISDDMSMMPQSFREKYLDKSGKLKPLKVKCYGGGDGVNSLSEVQEIKKFDLRYVYETATFKNNTDKDRNDFGVYHYLVRKNGQYPVEQIDNLQNKYENVSYDMNSDYNLTEWIYDDFSRENTNNPNYINIPANGEVTIHLGYFVLADSIDDDLLLNVTEDTLVNDKKIDTYHKEDASLVRIN
ncbi:MAG: hypothetical protein ACI4HM_09695 [Ruminococcus sp.]